MSEHHISRDEYGCSRFRTSRIQGIVSEESNPWEFETVRMRPPAEDILDDDGFKLDVNDELAQSHSTVRPGGGGRLPASLRHLFDDDSESTPDFLRMAPSLHMPPSHHPTSPTTAMSPSIIPSRERAATKKAFVWDDGTSNGGLVTADTPTLFSSKPHVASYSKQKLKDSVDEGPRPSSSQGGKATLPPLGPGIPRSNLPPLGPGIPRGLTPLLSHSPSSLGTDRWETSMATTKLVKPARDSVSSRGMINLDIPFFDDDSQPTDNSLDNPITDPLEISATPSSIQETVFPPRLRSKSTASQNQTPSANRPEHRSDYATLPTQERALASAMSKLDTNATDSSHPASAGSGLGGHAVKSRGRATPVHSSTSSTSSLSTFHAHQPAFSLDASSKPDRLHVVTAQLPLPPSIGRAHSASAGLASVTEQVPVQLSSGLGPQSVARKPSLNRQASVAVMETVPQAHMGFPFRGRDRSGSSASGLMERTVPELKDVLKVGPPISHARCLAYTQSISDTITQL